MSLIRQQSQRRLLKPTSIHEPVVTKNNEVTKQIGNQSHDERSRKNKQKCRALCQLWVDFCLSLNRYFEQLFFKLGYTIATKPTLTIVFGVVVPFFLIGGFFRYNLLQRTEDLYIPDRSQAFDDLHRAERFFPLSVKAEQFIIKNNRDSNILRDEIFKIILQIHGNITRIPNFSTVCIKNRYGGCVVMSPLEIFNYNPRQMSNVSNTLNNVYTNQSIILSNGRKAYTSYPYFFGYFKFDRQRGSIQRAESIHTVYLVHDPVEKDIYKKLNKFDRLYTNFMENMKVELNKKGLVLMYTSALGIESSISESAIREIMLIPVAFILMTIFCAITLLRFHNQVVGHFLVSFNGILCLFLGIGSAFGLIMMFGQPYIAFAGVLPFLCLGVGIDNIIIIIHAVDRQNINARGPQRVAMALSQIGASITMATMTTIVAFFVSMFSNFPAIRYFCFYAGLSILFCYIQVLTVFVALISYDVNRIEARRRDVLICCVEKFSGNIWEKTKERISLKIMRYYSRFLLKPVAKYTVLFLSILLTAFGIFGATNIDQSFDKVVLCAPESPYVEFYKYFNKAFPTGAEVSVIVDTPIDYADSAVQSSYADLGRISVESKYIKDYSINWMYALQSWASYNKMNISGPYFTQALHAFLKANPDYYPDLVLNKNGSIVASRMIMYLKDNVQSNFQKNAMLTLRQDLKSKSSLPAYPITYAFIFYEQFAVILQSTIRNIAICASAILIITLPYLVNPKVTLLVFFGFISLMFELFGIMYLWDVSLNALSMIILVMGIGFSVDYSAHIAHAFVKSKKDTSTEKVIDALLTMGSSVAMGGVSTFVGVMVKAFAVNAIFKIFFKMVFGIVILGLIHGLIILPVHLEIFCRRSILQVGYNNEEEENEDDENDEEIHSKENILLKNGNGATHQ